MKIALFGGSFNPPHLGHRAVVKDLAESDQFDEIWILPSFKHPFKKKLISFEDRIELCCLAFGVLGKKIKISRLEKELNSPHGYTIDLINHLVKKYPNHSFSLVVGTDLLQEKKRWKNFEEIEKKVSIFKISRSGYESSVYPNISSSEIREAIVKGEDLKPFLPELVIDFILQKRLYLNLE